MKRITQVLLCLGFCLLSTAVYAATIDYTTFSSAACNVFATSTKVNGYLHQTIVGQPSIDAYTGALELVCKDYFPTSLKGTEYEIKYPFKRGYSYKIFVTAASSVSTPRSTHPILRLRLNNADNGKSSSCSGAEPIDVGTSDHSIQQGVISSSWVTLTYDFTSAWVNDNYSNLLLGAISNDPDPSLIEIKKIEIVETAPPSPPAVTLLWSDHGTPGTKTVAGTVGMITYENRPYFFIQSNDQHVWQNWWNGISWNWEDHGTPGIGTVASSPGAVIVAGYPWAFVQKSDGHAWLNFWNGSRWNWEDRGTPGTGTVKKILGATAIRNSGYAFILGSDGHVWLNYWNGSSWNWEDHGTPGGGTVVVGSLGVVSIGGNLYAFVLGSDGHVWLVFWNGSRWNWEDRGTPGTGTVVSSLGALSIGGNLYAFVLGSDGHVWLNFWNGSSWNWEDHGTPGAGTVVGSLGAMSLNGGRDLYVFVLGSDGHVWLAYWNGSSWAWKDYGMPPSGKPIEGLGCTVVNGHPHCTIRGSDNHLWLLYSPLAVVEGS